MAETLRTERLEARIEPRQKRLLKKAAALRGQSLTDFVVSSAQEAARKTIREHEVMELTSRDQRVFVDALLHPPQPAKKLRQAAKRYRTIRGV